MDSSYTTIRRLVTSSSAIGTALRSLVAAVVVGALVWTLTKVPLGDNAWPISCVILLACAWFGGLVPSLVASLIFIFSLKAIQEDIGLFEFTRKELIDSALLLLLTSAVGWSREVWRRQAEQLREEARRKDQFLATLAHELRNPLAPLRNGLEILGMATIDAAVARDVHGMMRRQMTSMVRLIDDLLDVSRINSGKIALQVADVPLSEIVQESVEATRGKIEEACHELQIDLQDSPVFIRADRARISQVLQNLLINAAKFTAPGGKISLSAASRENRIEIKVRDSGIGIPGEVLPRVFDMFSQGDASRDRSSGGLGLGLHIVRTLVEMHGGSVEARSEGPGNGAEFVVSLPRAIGRENLDPPDIVKPTGSSGIRRKVLVVDDNEEAARTLFLGLKAMGHDCREVHNGADALATAQTFRPEVVVLDLGMPGMTGYEVARRARKMPEMKSAKIIAVTGWGQEEDRRKTREAGFDHHLVKPVEMESLVALFEVPAPEILNSTGTC